jgi:hypothetical protein
VYGTKQDLLRTPEQFSLWVRRDGVPIWIVDGCRLLKKYNLSVGKLDTAITIKDGESVAMKPFGFF